MALCGLFCLEGDWRICLLCYVRDAYVREGVWCSSSDDAVHTSRTGPPSPFPRTLFSQIDPRGCTCGYLAGTCQYLGDYLEWERRINRPHPHAYHIGPGAWICPRRYPPKLQVGTVPTVYNK